MTPQIFTIFRAPGPAAARIALLASLLCLCAFGVVTSGSQDAIQDTIHERELEDGIPKHLPIKVKVKNPDKFKDLKNERWLADLELEVTNAGNRPIYFLRLGISFVDVKKDSGAQIGYGLTYGRWKLMDINNRATPEDVPILPGGTHTFRLGRKSVQGWDWYRTKVEVKPQPKKIDLRFEALNFGDGTGFVTTSGLPVPEERGACEGGREGRASAARIRPGPPPAALFRKASFFLPAAVLPVNFFSAETRGPAPGESAPQSCCPNTQCERMKIITEGNCFCDEDRPATEAVVDKSCTDGSAKCAILITENSDCGEGIDYHTCVNYYLSECGGPSPTPTTEPTPLPPPPPPPNPYEGCNPRPLSGICPPGYFPNGGYCCPGGGSCGNFASPIATDEESDDAPTPNIAPGDGGGGCGCDEAERMNCFNGGGEWSETYCTCVSPVLIDIDGDGFDLTDGAGGVDFDFTGDGTPERLAWTAAASDDSWLFLDRDEDGAVDDGRELFGSFTPQPAPPPGEQRNGFLALAVYDWPGNGGNADGMIDERDAVYSSLLLWQDANHNGVSEPGELSALPVSGISAISLAYKESKRTDAHGNRFRYRAKVLDARGARAGRWAWDVFPVRPL